MSQWFRVFGMDQSGIGIPDRRGAPHVDHLYFDWTLTLMVDLELSFRTPWFFHLYHLQ